MKKPKATLYRLSDPNHPFFDEPLPRPRLPKSKKKRKKKLWM